MNYQKLAIQLAKKVKGRYRVSAIILDKRGKVLSWGINSYFKSHPKMKEYSRRCGNDKQIFLHAEIASLIKCKTQGYKIYICRIDSTGKNTLLAKPCPICELALKEHGISVIEYTTGD